MKKEWKLFIIEHAPENENSYKHGSTYETLGNFQKVMSKTTVSSIPALALKYSILENVMPEAKILFNVILSNVQRNGVYHLPVTAVSSQIGKS